MSTYNWYHFLFTIVKKFVNLELIVIKKWDTKPFKDLIIVWIRKGKKKKKRAKKLHEMHIVDYML